MHTTKQTMDAIVRQARQQFADMMLALEQGVRIHSPGEEFGCFLDELDDQTLKELKESVRELVMFMKRSDKEVKDYKETCQKIYNIVSERDDLDKCRKKDMTAYPNNVKMWAHYDGAIERLDQKTKLFTENIKPKFEAWRVDTANKMKELEIKQLRLMLEYSFFMDGWTSPTKTPVEALEFTVDGVVYKLQELLVQVQSGYEGLLNFQTPPRESRKKTNKSSEGIQPHPKKKKMVAPLPDPPQPPTVAVVAAPVPQPPPPPPPPAPPQPLVAKHPLASLGQELDDDYVLSELFS